MFEFIKQIFISTMIFFGSLSNVNPLECISMKNQERKVDQILSILIVIIPYFTVLVSK